MLSITAMVGTTAVQLLNVGLLGLLALTVLAVTLISLRKETLSGFPLGGLVPFTLIIAAVCAIGALLLLFLRLQSAYLFTIWFENIAAMVR